MQDGISTVEYYTTVGYFLQPKLEEVFFVMTDKKISVTTRDKIMWYLDQVENEEYLARIYRFVYRLFCKQR